MSFLDHKNKIFHETEDSAKFLVENGIIPSNLTCAKCKTEKKLVCYTQKIYLEWYIDVQGVAEKRQF